MDTQVIIEKLQKISSNTKMSPDEQLLFFVWIRYLLENEDIKKEFPTIYLYSNWILHTSLDTNSECGPIIARIPKSLLIIEQDQKTLSGEIAILKSLRFRELTNELIKLFIKYSLPIMILEFDNYINFLKQLISELLIDKPIILNTKNNKFKEWFNNITNKTSGCEVIAIESIFFHFEPNYWHHDDPTICAMCTNRNKLKIAMPIQFSSNLWLNVLLKTNIDDLLFS